MPAIDNTLQKERRKELRTAREENDYRTLQRLHKEESVDDPADLFIMPLRKQMNCVLDSSAAYAGSFVRRLFESYRYADRENRYRIRSTWPDYWIRYVCMGKPMQDKHEQ